MTAMTNKKISKKSEKITDNKERNKVILEVACELLENINRQIDDIFVEDIEAEEGDEEGEQVLVGVTVADPASMIGYKGRSLASLQQILGLMVKNKLGRWIRVLLDVNEYRQEQKGRLKEMVAKAGMKVKESGQAVSLAPMSSYERRLCHMAISEIEGVMTESEGEGEDRHVVIKPSV